MALERMDDAPRLLERVGSVDRTAVVGFFGDFSEASRKALPEFERACSEHPDEAAILVDAAKVPEANARLGVSSVPTVLVVKGGRVLQKIVGAQSAAFYGRALFGGAATSPDQPKGEARPAHRVVIYTSDTCHFCTLAKAHLRKHAVPFQEINVSRNEQAAQRMVAKSGQQGVPQLDIDGRVVVGFDKARIDALLGLSGAKGVA